jgi:hypothetical protein
MKKRLFIVRITGVLFLAAGLISLFAFPAEFSSFYPFSTGGAFNYDGFGFGSILFAAIMIIALIYASLALICIPAGIGNIKHAYWGYRLSRILFIAVIAVGISSVICIGFSFNLLNAFSVSQYIIIVSLVILTLVILPYLLLRFYNNQNTKQIFSLSTNTYFENQSELKMAVVLLNLVWVMAFVVMIFLKGAFPFMGRFIFKTQGTYLLSAVIFALLILTYLFYKNIRFIKYFMFVFYAFLVLSVVITFIIVPGRDFIRMLELPAFEIREMASLLNIVSGINMGYFFGAMIVIQTVLTIADKNKNRT